MGKATTQIETRLTGIDATAAAFASVKRRFAAFDKNTVLNKNLNPFHGLGDSKLAKGIGAGFKDVESIFASTGSAAAHLAEGIVGTTVAIAGLGVAVGGIVAKKGLEAIFEMNTLDKAAQKIGLTANELKKFEIVFEQAGLGGADFVESIIPKMNKALGKKEGLEALQQLGLSFENLSRMNPEARFKAVGAAVAGVGNDLDRAQLETNLFGKEGVKLDAIFRRGGASFTEAFDAVGALGGELEEKGVKAADRFADAWGIAKDRMQVGWQNFVGDMLVSFEDKFGPIDKAMLGLWNRAAAEAKILWLEVTTNGPSVFSTFIGNVETEFAKLPDVWQAAMDSMWESTFNLGTALEKFYARLFANILILAKGHTRFDAVGANAYEAFNKYLDKATEGPAKKKLDSLLQSVKDDWKAPELINLDDEKAKIREAALAKTAEDNKNLDTKAKLTKQTSESIEDGFARGANLFTEAVKEASGLYSGSYEAFKLLFRPAGSAATVGVAEYAGGLGGGVSGSGGGMSQLLASNALVVEALNNLLGLKRDSNRELTKIRDGVQAIGVA